MFRQQQVDAWSIPDVDAVCITTNGFVSKNGLAVVGLGVAKAASDRHPELGRSFARKLLQNGHVTQVVLTPPKAPCLVSFPVKPRFVVSDGLNVVSFKRAEYPVGSFVPGFHAKSEIAIIERSARELARLATVMEWTNVVLPRPGCGAGELLWEEVYDVMVKYLDERFIIVWK